MVNSHKHSLNFHFTSIIFKMNDESFFGPGFERLDTRNQDGGQLGGFL
jgi:hypothetical protein